jgi:type I restriction enzyme S subunit
MKDSGVPWLGQVPEHWDIVRNGRLFLQRNEAGHRELPILEVSLKTGVRVRDFEASPRKQVMSRREKYKVARAGDITYNTMRMWQGAVGLAPVDGLASPSYVVAQPLVGTNTSYFERVFRTPSYMSEVNRYSRGIVSDRNRLYWEDFKQIVSPLPRPAEQAAIVRFLEFVDRRIRRYIAAKRKMIRLLDEKKQVVIGKAATRGLDPNVRLKSSGVKWVGDVPDHWGVWKIGHLALVGNGSTPSRTNPAYWQGGTYPWLNSSCVNLNSITGSEQFVTALALSNCHLPCVQPGSVLVAITGQGKTRGTAAILLVEATINQHVVYISPSGARILPEYLHLALTAAYRELRAMSSDSGSTKGALTCGDIAHFKVPLPPPNEQAQIVSRVTEETGVIDTAIGCLASEISLLREYRARLIADVVTGKLDVREAAARLPDEPAEEEPPDEEDDLGEDEFDLADDLDAELQEAEA